MLNPLQKVQCIKILDEYTTKGSAPLKIIGSDDALYVAKFTNLRHPYRELINEVLCNYLAKCWGLNVPEIAVVSFSDTVHKGFNYSTRYKEEYFKNSFFGSKIFENSTDFGSYIGGVKKDVYSKFKNGVDFLKIGCFDHWIGNKDRKPDSINILVTVNPLNKLQFAPIDHTAAFAYLPYSDISDLMVSIDKTILQCRFVKSICDFDSKIEIEKLQYNVEEGIKNALEQLDFIFEQVPKEWGFSKKSRQKVKELLSNETRNKKISKVYFEFIK